MVSGKINIKEFVKNFLAFLGTFIFFDGVFPLLASQDTDLFGNWFYYFFATVVYIPAILYCFKHINFSKNFFSTNLVFTSLFLLTFFSVFWSVNISITIRSWAALLGSICFGIFLIGNFSIEDFLKILFSVIFVSVILSFLFILFIPELAIHQDQLHGGSWKGIFVHKNIMARNMSLGLIICFLCFNTIKYKVLVVLNIVGAFILLLFSDGKTGLIVVVVCLIITYPVLGFNRYASNNRVLSFLFKYFLFFSTVFVLVLIYKNLSSILVFFGGDLTLTGRTTIWLALIPYLFDRPFLGYGFGAFWDSYLATKVWLDIKSTPPHAHNAIIEMILDLGSIGLGLFITLLIKYYRNIWLLFERNKIRLANILLILMIYMILYMVPGNLVFAQNSINLLILMYGIYKFNNSNELRLLDGR